MVRSGPPRSLEVLVAVRNSDTNEVTGLVLPDLNLPGGSPGARGQPQEPQLESSSSLIACEDLW